MSQWTRSGQRIHDAGLRVLPLFEYGGLVVALIATMIAAGQEVAAMWNKGHVEISDLLLLFIYLEVVSMIEAYWRAGKLPVRMPLYITMVALARHLMLENQTLGWQETLGYSFAIVLLAGAVIVVRYGHLKLPYPDRESPRGLG